MKYKTITLPVTKVRDQFFDLVNAGYYAGQRVIITKQNKPVMELKPVEHSKSASQSKTEKKQALQKFLTEFEPFLTNADVTEYEQIRNELNTPRFPDW